MFSLKSLTDALKGEPDESTDGTEQNSVVAPQEVGKSLWKVASALSNSVKQRTADFAATIQETDWRSELNAFQQGFKEDTAEISEQAKVVTEELGHKAKNVAEKLPGVVEHLPGQAGALIQTGAKGAKTQLEHATKSFNTLSHRVVHGASDLFDQISNAIQDEMVAQDPTFARGPSTTLSSAPSGRYSRFEADVATMQRDSSTYCDEPEDTEQFEAFLTSFDLKAKQPDIDQLIQQNTFMSELQSRIVPLIVEHDVFWTRYFYRLHKLEQTHQQFVQLTQRAEQASTEEAIGWDSDDDDVAATATEEAPAIVTTTAGVTDVVAAEEEPPVQEEEAEEKVEIVEAVEEESIEAAQPSEDDHTHVASTGSDQEPWCVVESKSRDEVEEKPAAEEAVEPEAEEQVEEAEAPAVAEEEDKKADVEDDEDPFEDCDVPEGDADDDDADLDWGDDVANWE